MSKSLQDLLTPQENQTAESREITEISLEEAEEIAGGTRTVGTDPPVSCDMGCDASCL